MDGTCPEVIEVYIFKADSGEDDLGGTIDIVERESANDYEVELLDQNSSIHLPREKMVYMAVNDSQQEDEDLNVAEIADEVYYGSNCRRRECCCSSGSSCHTKQQIDDK